MLMKSKLKNRIVAILLMVSFMIMLLPVTPAVAANEGDLTGHSGFVFEYSTVEVSGKTLAKITVSAYNIGYAASHSIRFKYDESKLDFANPTNGRRGTVATAAPIRTVPQWIQDLDPYEDLGITAATKMATESTSPFATFDADNTVDGSDKIKIDLATDNSRLALYGLINGTEIKFKENTLTPILDIYFAGKATNPTDAGTTTSIPSDISLADFGLYLTDPGFTSGYGAMTSTNGVVAIDAPLWLGFPAPAATTYPVTVKVAPSADLANDSNTTSFLTSPGITITDPDNVTTSYKGGDKGVLTTAEGAAITNSILNLKEGTYNYTVTPGSSDTGYKAYTGTFSVGTGDGQKVWLHAQPVTAGEDVNYTITIKDGESADKKGNLDGVTVTVDGKVATTNASGEATFTAKTGNGKIINIAKAGHVTQSGTINLLADGKITAASGVSIDNNALVLNQTRTAVTITAQDNASSPIEGAQVKITAKADSLVTPNMAQNELPIIVKTNGSGQATVNLPNGDYVYTIISAANNEVVKEMKVADNKVTIGGTETSGTVGSDGNSTVSAPAETVTKITDRLYYVTGTWDNEASPSKMTVQVWAKNFEATAGTFGLKYDPKVFKLNTINGFALETSLVDVANYSLEGTTVANPTSEETATTAYHSFVWKAKQGSSVNSTAEAKLIATYNLDLTTEALNNSAYKTMMHDKTLFVKPYTKTLAEKTIATHFGADKALYDDFIGDYWKSAPESQVDGGKRYAYSKALDGGFHQIMETASGSEAIVPSDIVTQFVYDSYGNIATTFSVKQNVEGVAGAVIGDADITVTDGTTTYTAKTDAYGDAILQIPTGSSYTYNVVANGYKSKTNTALASDDVGKTIEVLLEGDDTHKVYISTADALDTKVMLLGSDRAQNGTDYYFNLAPIAGYSWSKTPAPGEITFTSTPASGNSTVISTGKITWDSAKNRYKLAGDAITTLPEEDLVITLDASIVITPVAKDKYTVTANAGTGGSFSYTANAGNTYNPSTPTEKINTVVESLGAGISSSAKYSFITNGPVSGNIPTTPDATYEAYVINEFIVNGTPMTLTDYERINGVNIQLHGISEDQTIYVTYGTATVDVKDPDSPGDDSVGPITPVGDSVITMVVGEYGKAAVNAVDQNGYSRKDYKVAANGNFEASITANTSVAMPDGTTKDYEIDQVLVDGKNAITGEATNAAWDEATGKLTLSTIPEGSNHVIIVTFKPLGGNPIQATVTSVRKVGEGTIATAGTSIYNIGDQPVYTVTPADAWDMLKLDLTEPNGTAQDKTADAVKNSTNLSYNYKFPALKGGNTVIEYSFDEFGYTVEIPISYGQDIVPFNGATFTFKRVANGSYTEKTQQTGQPTAYKMVNRFELPAGTWDIVVSKNGYLDFTITGFDIKVTNGVVSATGNTEIVDGIIKFGKVVSMAQHTVMPIIGDADWDGSLVTLKDIAQVANGMVPGATDARKKRSDVDESISKGTSGNEGTSVTATDMGYVTLNYGKRAIETTYADFIVNAGYVLP